MKIIYSLTSSVILNTTSHPLSFKKYFRVLVCLLLALSKKKKELSYLETEDFFLQQINPDRINMAN